MPSIEQCQVKSDTMAVLPVFDKFNSSTSPEGVHSKDSDSEESFHFTLDEEEEGDNSGPALPNTPEETEEEILNRFDNGPEEATPTVDTQDEEAILNDSLKEDEPQVNKTEVKVTCKVDANYANRQDGQFKSVYEADIPSQSEAQKSEDVKMPEQEAAKEESSQTEELQSNQPEPSDDADLLDVSMVRETEEDDACAIADALEDQETQEQSNEKSDEEQSDRTDAEPEENSVGSDDADSNEASNKAKTAKTQPEEEKAEEPVKEKPKCESPKICDSKSESAAEKTVSKEKVSEECKMDVQNDDASKDTPKNEEMKIEDNSDSPSKPSTKRSHPVSESPPTEVDTSQAKKPKLSLDLDEEIPSSKITVSTPQFQTLSGFAAFMKCRKLTSKLSRSDLEQFGLQKAGEVIMLRSSEGEYHQALRRYEKVIETLRKDMQQLIKQCKDLEIVNRKLMGDMRTQNINKKPLVPLKITRSVGLQVRLNPGNELVNQARRRQPTVPATPPKNVIVSPNRVKVTPTAMRQVVPNVTAKQLGVGQTQTTPPAPMLTHALQKRPVVAKRTTPVKKTPENAQKPTTPGVIDLTDEDDKIGRTSLGLLSPVKVNKPTTTTTATPNKVGNAANKTYSKTITHQGKQASTSPRPGTTAVANKGNNSLSPGLRLTTTNGNGSPQMVYVVPTLASNGTGQQKVAFVNFQPTNGLTLNGSVMANKPGQTLTLKTVALRQKHPAPLPVIQRINRDPKLKPLLPKPHLTIKKIDTGIILQWKMPYNLDLYESIASYQLYAYQETSAPPSTDMWRKVGDVKALALPMACTLTQFADKNKYYFAVRSVDVHKRIGAFSDPEEISL